MAFGLIADRCLPPALLQVYRCDDGWTPEADDNCGGNSNTRGADGHDSGARNWDASAYHQNSQLAHDDCASNVANGDSKRTGLSSSLTVGDKSEFCDDELNDHDLLDLVTCCEKLQQQQQQQHATRDNQPDSPVPRPRHVLVASDNTRPRDHRTSDTRPPLIPSDDSCDASLISKHNMAFSNQLETHDHSDLELLDATLELEASTHLEEEELVAPPAEEIT